MTREKIEELNQVGQIIRMIVSEKGIDVFRDVKAFMAALQEKNVKPITIMQLGTLVEVGNVRNYLTQVRTGITMVDVNNMVSCAVMETGFTKQTIQSLLTCVLYGLNLPTAIETITIPGEESFFVKEQAIIPLAEYGIKLRDIKQAVKNRDEARLASESVDFERMVQAGIPEAQYLKGLCYWEGIATEVDHSKGFKHIIAAARAGHAEANAYLGDYYFNNAGFKDYTLAFEYYTQIGAIALSQERKENVKVILSAKKQNFIELILNGIILIMLYIFNSRLGAGAFAANAEKHWGLAIVSDVLITAFYGLSIFYLWKKKYNGIKWVTVAMFVAATITTFWALM